MDISLPIGFNICFGCSKEPSHLDGSFEYPQHILSLRNKKIHFYQKACYSAILSEIVLLIVHFAVAVASCFLSDCHDLEARAA